MFKQYCKTAGLIIVLLFLLLILLSGIQLISQAKEGPKKPNLKVLITGKGSHPDDSFVVLEDLESKEQGLYQLGESFKGMKLIDILKDKVIFKKDEKQEEFSIPKPQKDEDLLPELEKSIKKVDEHTWKIPKGQIIRVTKNPHHYGISLMAYGHFKDGQLSGIEIDDIKPDSLLTKLGLKNKDIIKRVNGQKIEEPKQAFKLYLEMMVKPKMRVKVDIERDQKEETLIYEIE